MLLNLYKKSVVIIEIVTVLVTVTFFACEVSADSFTRRRLLGPETLLWFCFEVPLTSLVRLSLPMLFVFGSSFSSFGAVWAFVGWAFSV